MSRDDIEIERSIEAVYTKKPISIDRGEDVYLYDSDGERYLDMGASYGVMAVGHSNPAVVDAVSRQAERLTYVQASYSVDERARLLERLVEHTPTGLDRVFLANAGTEANETAFKLSRASTGSTEVVAAKRGFHGRTYGSMSMTWRKKYRQPFAPLVPDVEFVTFDDVDSLEQKVSDDTAAVFLEPVQGEAGVHPASKDYLERARELCTEHDAYLVFDEIQAGVGRTGYMWSHEHYDVVPDAITTAKSLGGGLPISALVCRAEMTEIPRGSHGGTYNGGPVAAAAARAALDYVVDEDLPSNAAERGEQLMEDLRDIDSDRVVEVRGRGLMVAVQVRGRSGRVLSALADEGVLALPAGKNAVRLLPPLTLTERHVEECVGAMEAVL
ncbi:MAG: aspartate aminotransferase family protein [Halobacteriales archaeon]